MQVNKEQSIHCPCCKRELGPVEAFADTTEDIGNINDCPECGESFEVRDNKDGTFEVCA